MIKRSLLLSLLLATGSIQVQAETGSQPDLAKAKQIAETVCAGCHSADGNSQLSANPKLAGQHPEYLYKQLSNFSSVDGKAPERVNAVMNGMVAMLSTDEDKKAMAAYFASQQLKPESAKNNDTIVLGQQLWRAGDASKGLPACAGCHGPAGAGLPVQDPRLSGQFAEYIEAQLKLFRSGERANDPAKMMRMIAIKMTDPEIKAVSDYAAGLR